HLRGKVGRIGKCIDQGKLAAVIEKRLLLVLAMDVQKQGSQLPQGRDGARLVINVDPVSFVRRNFTSNYNFVTFGIQTKTIERTLKIRLEDCFDDGTSLPRSHHFRRGFSSSKQSERVNDHRFSSARFARKKVETIAEVKFDLVDESKITNTKKPQHTRGL